MPQVWTCAICKKIVRETDEYIIQTKLAQSGLETRVHATCVEGK